MKIPTIIAGVYVEVFSCIAKVFGLGFFPGEIPLLPHPSLILGLGVPLPAATGSIAYLIVQPRVVPVI